MSSSPLVSYDEVASADEAWTCLLMLPAVPVDDVLAVLVDFARTDWPVNAFAFTYDGTADTSVIELLLYRDPSKTFGTPSPARCDRAAQALVTATGWTAVPERGPRTGMVIGLGLREGYDQGAIQHEPGEVTSKLAATVDAWTCRPALLLSTRLVGSAVRDHVEAGVVLHGDEQLLPAVADLARTFSQHRFAVTDLTGHRTYVLEASL